MRVISIQSQTVVGRVGNSMAGFALQRLGVDAMLVPTLVYSNHPGLGEPRGRAFSGTEIDALIAGAEEQDALTGCDAVLSGYFAELDTGEAVARAVGRVRAANPNAFYCCDPVLGDAPKGLYVQKPVAEFIRDRLVAEAEVITPNCFELGWLTGKSVANPALVLAAAGPLVAAKPRFVLVTSLPTGDRTTGMMLVTPDGAWVVSTPKRIFQRPPNGGGDLTAAVFLAQLLKSQDPVAALSATAGAVYAVYAATLPGDSELALITAQNALATPPTSFPVEKYN